MPNSPIAKLRSLSRSRSEFVLSPRVPDARYPNCRLRGLEPANVEFETSDHTTITVPIECILEVLDLGSDRPPHVKIKGRIQWFSIEFRWRYFPEDLPSGNLDDLGVGRHTKLDGSAIDSLYFRLRSSGWEPGWPNRLRLGEIAETGWQVYYGDDGKYLQCGDLVMCIKPIASGQR